MQARGAAWQSTGDQAPCWVSQGWSTEGGRRCRGNAAHHQHMKQHTLHSSGFRAHQPPRRVRVPSGRGDDGKLDAATQQFDSWHGQPSYGSGGCTGSLTDHVAMCETLSSSCAAQSSSIAAGVRVQETRHRPLASMRHQNVRVFVIIQTESLSLFNAQALTWASRGRQAPCSRTAMPISSRRCIVNRRASQAPLH